MSVTTARLWPDPTPLEIAQGRCPDDAPGIMAALAHRLYWSMKSRANGTRHLDSCRNARVNATWFPCQDECTDAQTLIVWAQTYRQRHAPAEQARRLEAV